MMTSLATRSSVLLLKETFGGGVILLQSRSLLVPFLRHRKASFSTDGQDGALFQDLPGPNIPYPISCPIYGEGWRGYSRLVIPTYDMTATWATEVSKRAIIDTATYSRNLIGFISTLDRNTAYLLLVKKSRQSTDYLLTELGKSREQLLDSTVDLTARTKDAVTSGRASEIVADRLTAIWNMSKDLSNFLRQKIKNNEDLVKKVTSASNKTKDYTVSLYRSAKNTKIPNEFYERSGQLVEMSKANSAAIYRKSKELSKVVIERSKVAGESMVHRLADTYSQAPAMMIMIRNSKYVGNFQEALRRFEANTPKQDYTYVNRFFSRVPKTNVTNVVQATNKTEFPSMPPKQEFHSSAVEMVRPERPSLNDYPQFLIFECPRALTNIHMTSEISTLIPTPVKKIWRGLRDKTLPSLQGTIASILQKIQDAVVKKKK